MERDCVRTNSTRLIAMVSGLLLSLHSITKPTKVTALVRIEFVKKKIRLWTWIKSEQRHTFCFYCNK